MNLPVDGLVVTGFGFLLGLVSGGVGWAINQQLKISKLQSDVTELKRGRTDDSPKLDLLLSEQIKQGVQLQHLTEQLRDLQRSKDHREN